MAREVASGQAAFSVTPTPVDASDLGRIHMSQDDTSSGFSSDRRSTIWTVGHSTRPIEEFLEILQSASITAVADVRRFPGSRRYPQYNQQALADSLAAAGIKYVWLPELGGRRQPRPDSLHMAWRNASFRGYADYMDTDAFEQGIDRVSALAEDGRVALMCSEALWWQCHRSLISDYLKIRGYCVIHLLAPNKQEEHPYTAAAEIVDGQLSYAA
jgi:uncharacterized protein (DUF488 family)